MTATPSLNFRANSLGTRERARFAGVVVAGVEQLVEMGLEKFKRIAGLRLGLHGIRA